MPYVRQKPCCIPLTIFQFFLVQQVVFRFRLVCSTTSESITGLTDYIQCGSLRQWWMNDACFPICRIFCHFYYFDILLDSFVFYTHCQSLNLIINYLESLPITRTLLYYLFPSFLNASTNITRKAYRLVSQHALLHKYTWQIDNLPLTQKCGLYNHKTLISSNKNMKIARTKSIKSEILENKQRGR